MLFLKSLDPFKTVVLGVVLLKVYTLCYRDIKNKNADKKADAFGCELKLLIQSK